MALFEYEKLVEIRNIPTTTSSALLANLAGEKCFIRSIIIHNTNSTTETVKLYNCPNNGGDVRTVVEANHTFWYGEIESHSTVMLEFPTPGIVLDGTNDCIKASTTSSGVVTIQMFGGKE